MVGGTVELLEEAEDIREQEEVNTKIRRYSQARGRYYVVAEEVGTGKKKTGYTYNNHFSKGRTCGCEINDLQDK